MSSEAVVEAHAVESTIALAAHEAVGRVNLPLLNLPQLLGEGEWWWESGMGPKVKVKATAGAGR